MAETVLDWGDEPLTESPVDWGDAPLDEARAEKGRKLRAELEDVRGQNRFAKFLAQDPELLPYRPPGASAAAAFASPIGQPLRPMPAAPALAPVVQAVNAGVEAATRPISEMSRPSMLPLAPLAMIPGPAGHLTREAMGLYFGGQAVGAGAGELSVGLQTGDPRQIGAGVGSVALGGTLAAEPIARAIPRVQLPESLRALAETEPSTQEASRAVPIEQAESVLPLMSEQPFEGDEALPAETSTAGVSQPVEAPQGERPQEVLLSPEEKAAAPVQPEVSAAQSATPEAQPKVEAQPETTPTPEPVAAPAEAQAKAQEEVSRVAKTEGTRSAKEIKAELVAKIQAAIKDAPDEALPESDPNAKITIDIPGDGTFTVWNMKEPLTTLLARAKRIETASSLGPKIKNRTATEGLTAAEWLESSEPTHDLVVRGSSGGKPTETVKQGRPVTIPGHEDKVLFLTADKNNFTITEPRTGLSVGSGDTVKAAIANAKEKLTKAGPQKYQQALEQAIKSGEKPPPKLRAAESPVAAPVAKAESTSTEPTIPTIGLRESEATPMNLGKLRKSAPERYADLQRYFGVKEPGEIAKLAKARFEEMRATQPPRTEVHFKADAIPPDQRPLGIVSSSATPFWNMVNAFETPVSAVGSWLRDLWRSAALKAAPRITDSSRTAGEAAVRYAQSFYVGRMKGLEFARKVIEQTKVDLLKFGVALVEDNLRGIKDAWNDAASKATSPEEQAAAKDRADRVRSIIGAEHSPFKTEAEYQAFLADSKTQQAIQLHRQLWAEQKDPLFRKANDLDPETELASRGKQTGARINLKALQEGEKGATAVGRPPKYRQMATLKRRDPFARRASGTAPVYEGNYNEIMAHGFEKELPVATQHEFIRELIESGDAKVTDTEFPEDLSLKGEATTGRLLKLNPWRGKFLQVRRSLLKEYDGISGYGEDFRIPYLTPFFNGMTRMSVQGFAEGSTHVSNLLTEVFTGVGPTAHPMINALVKSLGRVDLLYSLPKVLIQGLSKNRERLLNLAEIGAAKEPYKGGIGAVINVIDRGVRLSAEDVFDSMAEKGLVEKTETNKREFINQVGSYNKRLQPWTIRKLREAGIQPFVTAAQTFNVMGLRRMLLAPGVKASNAAAALGLRADIAGGIIGGVVLIGALNKILSGKATGPTGTQFGNVGWKDEKGKTRQFNLLRLLGYERGLRITGIGPYLEAKRVGLSPKQQMEAAGQSVASTAAGYVMGPGPRAATIGLFGLRPTQPWQRQVPTVPPNDSNNPLKTQMAANIETALIESNPVTATISDVLSGKSLDEIRQRQFNRYTPRAARSESLEAALPRIVNRRQLVDYADDLARETRKLPMTQRWDFVMKRFKKDGLESKYTRDALTELRRKGVFKYE